MKKIFLIPYVIAFTSMACLSQTDIDGIMMEKNAFCIGPMFGIQQLEKLLGRNIKKRKFKSWNSFYQMFSVMGNYGISNKLNVLFGLPYVLTKASAGQLNGQEGVQDLSLWIKWKAYSKKVASVVYHCLQLGLLYLFRLHCRFFTNVDRS
jgi:hypothetical protein